MDAISVLRKVGKGLCIAASLWMIFASVSVIADVYILFHAGAYHPAALVVSEVVFSRGCGESSGAFRAQGTIDGAEEYLPLHEFAGISGGLLSIFSSGERYPRTQEEAERYATPGQSIPVHFNPAALDLGVGNESLRVLVYHEAFPKTYWRNLLLRDLPLFLGPLLLGLLLTGAAGILGRAKPRTGRV
jgi:hypothetical protein